MKRLLILFFGMLVLCSCSDSEKTPESRARNVKFKEAEYIPFQKNGNGRIRGRLCIVNDENKRVCPADQTVVLNPVTDYSAEWYERYWVNNEPLEPAHPTALRRSRMVQTDKKGFFMFKRLPPGKYYVGAVACPYTRRKGMEHTKKGFNYQRWAGIANVDGRQVNVKLRKVFEEE